MQSADNVTLSNIIAEVLDDRSIADFDTFEEFWEELDALFWYDGQDAGESCSADKDEFEAIFNSLKKPETNPFIQGI